MKRHLLNFVTLLSLLLCLLAAGEWAFNRWSTHGVIFSTPSGFALALCRPNDLGLAIGHYLRPPEPRDFEPWMRDRAWAMHGYSEATYPDSASAIFGSRLGFGTGRYETGIATNPNSRIRYLLLPYWFIATVAAAPVATRAARQWQRRRRVRRGHCRSCGYDLRATPGRCPECGVTVSGPGR